MTDVQQIATRQKCSVRQVNMTISLAFLAPDLVRAAVEGRLPRGIGVERLARCASRMEPTVRSPRTESAIITDQARTTLLACHTSKIPRLPNGIGRRKPCRGERNFWMQRREAKIGLRDRKCLQRPKERNDTNENPHRNGLFRVGAGICGLGRTGWWCAAVICEPVSGKIP